MKNLLKLTTTICVIFLLTTIIFSQPAKKIDELMSEYAKFEQFNGTILVAEKDKIIYQKAFGTANFKDKVPNKIDSRFRIASISKPFTATLIFQLIAEKKINLDDKISKFLLDFSSELGNKITIRHLLTHTSGLPDFFRLPNWQNVMFDPKSTMADFTKLAYSVPLDFQPGEKYAYCNVNFLLLGVILEKVLNASYEQILTDKILKPAGLSNSGISFEIPKIPNHVFGYQRNRFFEYEPEGEVNIKIAQPAGGLYSTTEDLFKFARAVFKGKILSAKFVQQMTAAQITEGDKTYPERFYAFGWHLDSAKIGDKKVKFIEHGGNINGFQSLLTYLPEKQITIAFLVNTDYVFEFQIRNKILEILHNQPTELPLQSYCQFFIQQIKKDGFTNALNSLPPNDKKKFYTSQDEFNRLGYHYLRSNSPKEAIEVFKLNVKFFPNSANVYNSLGEAFEKNNDIGLAKENYQKAIDLAVKNNDEDLETFKESLKKLLEKQK